MKNRWNSAKQYILLIVGICLVINVYGGWKKQTRNNPNPVVTTDRILNPVSPPGLYIADPEVRQMPDGRIYMYGSRDEPGKTWCSNSYHVLMPEGDNLMNLEWIMFENRK